MARSITIRAIDRRADRTYVRVGSSEIEIPASSAEELKAWIRAQFDDSDERMLAFALAMWISRNPDLSNPGQIVGRTFTLDFAGRVNYPDSVVRVS
jgi:hypothetical protein